MKKTRYFIVVGLLILTTVLLTLSFASCQKKEPENTTYTIIVLNNVGNEIDIYVHTDTDLRPELVADNGQQIDALFNYEYDRNVVTISEHGVITPLVTEATVTEITVIELRTDTRKTFKVNIKDGLRHIGYIHDENGEKVDLSAPQIFEIGESYSYKFDTTPSVVDLDRFFTCVAVDETDTEKNVFDVSVEGNTITFTPTGVGEGILRMRFKNEDERFDKTYTVPFVISFPSEAFTQAILKTAEKSLLSVEELQALERIVFDENVNSFSAVKSDKLISLRTMVFESQEIVELDLENVSENMVFRVNGLDLYEAYRSNEKWSNVSGRIYPYIDSVTDTVIVYHNEDTYTLADTVLSASGVVHLKQPDTKDYQSGDGTALFVCPVVSETEVATLQKDGYRFVGWRDEKGYTFNHEDISKIREGIHLWAVWEAETYRVILHDYNSADGTKNRAVDTTYHQGIPSLPDGVKDGWEFKGWYLSEDYREDDKVRSGFVYDRTEDVTLYAKYEATLTFDYRGGLENKTATVVYGKALGELLPRHSTINGWDFCGWNTSTAYLAQDVVTADLPYVREGKETDGFSHTLYVRAEKIVSLIDSVRNNSSKIALILGLNLKDSLAVVGQSWDTYSSRYGTNETGEWTFVGWTTQDISPDSANMLVYDAERLIRDTHCYDTIGDTVYAVYKGDLRFVHGTVGEDNYIDQTVYYGFTYGMPDDPVINSYEGYTYLGWLVDGNYVKEKTCRAVVSTAGSCVYAYYDANAYYLHFHDEFGQEILDERIAYHDVGYDTTDRVLNNDIENFVGRTVVLPDVPNKAGEWIPQWELSGVRYDGQQVYTIPEGVYEDQAFKATYASGLCEITFDTHGYGIVSPKIVAYNTKIGTLEAPSSGPNGYQFVGWYTDKTYRTEITAETIYRYKDKITLYAKYVITVDCVGFDQTEKRSFVYGTRISMADPSDKSNAEWNNWVFDGWYGEVYNYGTGEYVERNITLTDMNSFVLTLKDNKLVARWKRELHIEPDPTDSGYFHMPGYLTSKIVYRGEDFSIDTPICQNGRGWSFDTWYYLNSTNKKNICEDLFELINTTNVDTIYAQYHANIEIQMRYNKGIITLAQFQEVILGENINTWENFAQYMDDCQKIPGYHFAMWKIGSISMTANAFVVEKDYVPGIWVIVLDPNPYYIQYSLDAENKLLNTPKINGGGTIKREQIFDQEFALAEASCTGYKFKGWKITVNGVTKTYAAGEKVEQLTPENGGTVVATAVWEPITYSIEFNKNSGDNESDILSVENISYTDYVTMKDAPQRTGYIFLCWQRVLQNNMAVSYNPGDKVRQLSSEQGDKVVLIAVWEPISYKIVFNLNGGAWDAPLEKEVKYDGPEENNKPSKNGYIYGGWFLDSDLTESPKDGKIKNLTTVAGETVQLYAKWIPITYSIDFDCNFEQPDASEPIFDETPRDYEYGRGYSISDPKLKGYVFLGWCYTNDKGDETLVEGVHDTEESQYRIENLTSTNGATVNLYAKWRPIKYKIHLVAGDGRFNDDSSVLTIDAKFAESVSLSEEAFKPKRYGYDFDGWEFNENFYWDNALNLTTVDEAEVTLTAVWKPMEYEIILDANGGIFSDTGTTVVNIGYSYDSESGVAFKEPYKKGYSLIGWATDPNAEEPEFDVDYDGKDNRLFEKRTLYALWSPNPYEVRIDCAGGFWGLASGGVTSRDIETKYDDWFTVDEVQRPWYELIGWIVTADGETISIDSPETEFSNLTETRCGVVVMQAVWAPAEYEITYCDPNGNSLGLTSKYTIESKAYNHPAVPERTHYLGIWNTYALPTSEKDEPGDRTVTAYYAPIAYNLDYVLDGKIIKRVVYTVDNVQDLENHSAPAVPSKVGYTVAWPDVDREALKSSLGNAVCEAICTPIEYTLEFYEDQNSAALDSMQVTVELETLTLPALTPQEGYTINWDFSIERMIDLIAALPEGETTIRVVAMKTPINYTVTVYDTDGTYKNHSYNAESLTEGVIRIYAPLDTVNFRYVCENAECSYDEISGYLTIHVGAYGNMTVSVVPIAFDTYYTVTLYDGEQLTTLIYENADHVAVGDFPMPSRVGYDFVEWRKVDSNEMSARYEAVWQPHVYGVHLDLQGGAIDGETELGGLEYGKAYALAQIPTRQGYKFVGWVNPINGNIVPEILNLTSVNGETVALVASWRPNRYNIVYQSQFDLDGEAEIVFSSSAVYDASFRLAATPVRKGYIFMGWRFGSSLFTAEKLVQNLSSIDGDTVVLNAEWRHIQYTVEFENCDNAIKPFPATYDTSFELPDTVTRPGWLFKNWAYIVDGRLYEKIEGDKVVNLADTDGETVKVVAIWSPAPSVESEPNIYFNDLYYGEDNELTMMPLKVNSGTTVKLPTAYKAGYTFVTWRDFSTNIDYLEITADKSIGTSLTLTAIWTPTEYTIRFADVTELTYTVESMPTLPAVPSWYGYIGEWDIPESPIGDITVYPVYHPVRYAVHLDSDGGDLAVTSYSVQYGTSLVMGVPQKSGYIFMGWSDGSVVYSGTDPVDMTLTGENGAIVELTALWIPEETRYTATFVVDGQVLTQMAYTEADLGSGTLVMPKVPVREHYNAFWSVESLPLADVTVHATYVPILYSVTFMADGHEVSVSYYTVETPLSVIPAVPKKTGYMNECWEFFNMVGGDLIVQAKYTPIGYRVVFANNNGQPSVTEQAIYDEPVTLRFDLVREGYTFRGWENTADGTVYEGSNGTTVLNLSSTNDSEILLSAIWEPVQYTMTFEGCDHTVTFTVETDPNALQLPEIPNELVKKHHVATWAIPNTLPATDAEIKVAYTEIVYTVIFDLLKDKTGLDPIVKSWQVSMGALAEPKLGGFVWSLDPSLYVPYDLMDAPFVEERIDSRIEYTLHLYPVGMGDNKYSITFRDDQGVVLVKNTSAPLNQAIEFTIPAVPSRIGYMGKWVVDHSEYQDQYIIEYTEDGKVRITRMSENAPTSVVIMADYTPIQYTVRYDLAGGILDEGAVLADLTAEYNVTYAVTDMIPTRVGYKFVGWVYTDTDGNETVLAPASNSIINLTTVNHDVVVLKAKWVARQYEVVAEKWYNAGDRFKRLEIVLMDSVAYDTEFVLPNVAPEHYEQIGWMINGEFYEINTVFKNLATGGTVTVEPVLRGKEHTVELYANGVCVGTVKYRYGDDTYKEIVEMIQEVTPPEKAFYAGEWSIGKPDEYLPLSGEVTIFGMDEFSGNGNNRNYIAVVDNNGTILGPTIEGIYDEIFGSMIHDPHEYGVIFPKTITAEYIPVIYDVEFMVDGMIVKKDRYTVESHADYPELPTKEHYTAAWDIGTLPGGDVTVTAVYTPIVYTVTFALPNGTVVDISQYTVEDKTVHMPAVPDGYDAWDITPLVGGDVTVYAMEKKNDPIILTFVDSLGNRVGAVTVEEGKQLPPLPTVPEIQGYMGNWKLPETVTESMTVYPEYELIEYHVYFYDENGEIVPVVGMDGQARDYATYTILNHSVTIPSVPFKDYYRGRWDIPALTTGDVEVYVVYEPIVYKVTFLNPDMSVYDVRVFTIENMIVEVPKGPAYVGHTFTHWSTTTSSLFDKVFSGAISDAGNFTAYPKYSVNTYSITYVPNGGTIKDWIYDSTYTVKDSISVPTDVLYHKYSDFNHFLGWYYDPSCTRPFDNDELKRNPRNVTLYAKWDLIDHYYIGIDNTPWSPGSGRVVIDWSMESDTNLKNHHRPLDDWNKDRPCDMDIYSGTKEIYFIGSPEKLYDSFKLIFCQFAEGQNITIHFVNFRFKTNGCGLTTYDSNYINLTIDVIGECWIDASDSQSTAIEMGHCNITFEGDGELTVWGADGANSETVGGSGNSGGHAVYANNVTIDMLGKINLIGGQGGSGKIGKAGASSGENGGSGGSGGAGGEAIKATDVTFVQGGIILIGGNGGAGASGGKGFSGNIIKADGAGGNGGSGGAGGDAIQAQKVTIYSPTISLIQGGKGGDGGSGGNAGTGGWKEPSGGAGGSAGGAGKGVNSPSFTNYSGVYDINDGTAGTNGPKGKDG